MAGYFQILAQIRFIWALLRDNLAGILEQICFNFLNAWLIKHVQIHMSAMFSQ